MIDKIEFPVKEGYPIDTIRKVQSRLLEMAKTITGILDKHGLEYFITLGTLLGAVRHKGYIPWDDDFDIMILDDIYDVALDCLRRELPNDMLVHDRKSDPIYWPAWAKIRDVNTIAIANLWPDDNRMRYLGLNVDIYRVKRVKKSQVLLYQRKEGIEFLVRKYTSGLLAKSSYESKFNEWTSEYARLLNESHSGEDEEGIAFVAFFDYQRLDTIYPLRKYVFEGHDFWGPNNYDDFLSVAYGDYMTPPPFNKRLPHYDEVIFLGS